MNYVWVNGCFDVLHRGHIELFKYAKSLGEALIVGVDTDIRVATAKGSTRPVNVVEDRKFILESIKYIDRVVSFESDEELANWIDFFKPKYMVIGSDWKNKKVVGQEYADKIVFFDRVPGYSTSKIIGDIK